MTPKKPKERLDCLLFARGFADSREQAGRLILTGAVHVNGSRIEKPAKRIVSDACIDVKNRLPPFVSRAGGKLVAALDAFQLDVSGLIAMDVGASTGGFTDCLLQRSARRVYAVDVGYGQLDWRLRRDPRVVVLERCNVRYLDPALVPDPIDMAVIDVSFISLTIVLSCALRFLQRPAAIIALVKPQFEVGRGQVGRGGIVRDEFLRQAAAKKILEFASTLGLVSVGLIDSPISGQKGNREMLAGFRWPADASIIGQSL